MKSCEMHTLVSARRDGRLGDKESASVERHLRGCASCRSLTDDLDELAELGRLAGDVPEPSPLEHRRRRLAVLRAAAAPRAAETDERNLRPIAYAVAAIAALFVAWLSFGQSDITRTAQSVPPNQSVVTAARAPIAASVSEAPSARFDRQTTWESGRQLERVRLYEGTVDVQVNKLTVGQRFIVATSDAEVEVRGTRFSVVAVDDRLREVAVQEGVVEVRSGGNTITLRAGDAWNAPERVAMNDEPEEPQPVVAPAPPTPAPEENDVPAEPEEVEEEPTPTPKPKRKRSAASKEFAAAMGKLDSGDYAGATDALRGFSKKHGNDARAEDADFLTIIALQRAGRHAAAARAARSYLAKYPSGSRRAEAQAIANRKPN